MSIHNELSIFDNANTKGSDEHGNARKRKRHDLESIELDTRTFAIRPSPDDPFAKPRLFTPLQLILRAQLPLAYLDTSTSTSNLFSAHIHIFEAVREHDAEPSILIAQEEKEERLYAIERAGRRTYALCTLAKSVTIRDLKRRCETKSVVADISVKRWAIDRSMCNQPWWTTSAIEQPENLGNKQPKESSTPTLSMVHSDHQKILTAARALSTHKNDKHQPAVPAPTGIPRVEEGSLLETAVSASDTLQELSKRYLDALYLSRTSLAYFTKGPLSRARAAFTGDPGSETHPSEFVAMLREAVLTSIVLDKKYRDGVTAHVSDLPVQAPEPSEQSAKPRKKRNWKAKRDKAGFFLDEKDYVERWWFADEDGTAGPSSGESRDAALKRRLPKIRTRETYMQLILVLEIMALELSIGSGAGVLPPELPTTDESQGQETQAKETRDPKQNHLPDAKKKNAKKPQDLSALLDTLVDRICIWHSLESHSPSKKREMDGESCEEQSNDELRSFCTDVVIPFYMSRIPQQAAMVNKKLGGPSAPTPVKRTVTAGRKPGEPAVRPAPVKKPRQPLQRVSTETLNHPTRPPPRLHRSATDSQISPFIKREASETPSLKTIPAAKPPLPRKRTSLMHSISFSKREVDLSAMSQANEVKARKKAETEEKLREAIATLKKPNRPLATKELAESADQSFAQATSKVRPGQIKQRERPLQSVHVTATPSHRRSVKATPYKRSEQSITAHQVPISSVAIPSSSVRYLAPPGQPASTFAVPKTGHRSRRAEVEATPSRGIAKSLPPGGYSKQVSLLDSPVAQRHTVVAQTPSKPTRMLQLTDTPMPKSMPRFAHGAILPPAPLVEASPNPTKQTLIEIKDHDEGPTSIYDNLGWHDDYEELA